MPLKIWRTPGGRAQVACREHEVCSRSLRKNNRVPKKHLEKPKPETGDLDRSGPGNLKKKSKTGSGHGPRIFGMKRKTEIKPEPVGNRESFRPPC